MVLCVGGSDYDAARAVESHVVFCLCVVQSHTLERDANKVWVNRVEGFSHVPCADAASAAALLNFFLQVNQIKKGCIASFPGAIAVAGGVDKVVGFPEVHAWREDSVYPEFT
jgi:hypothetical protein